MRGGDEQVRPSVAVHIGGGQLGGELAHLVGKQHLQSEIVIGIFLVHMVQADRCRVRIAEQGRGRGRWSGVGHGATLVHHERGVHRRGGEARGAQGPAAGPVHDHFLHAVVGTQPEMEHGFHTALVSAYRAQLLVLLTALRPDRDLRAPGGPSVHGSQPYTQVVVAQAVRMVLMDAGRLVQVVHHQVQVAIAVQIGISGSVAVHR